MACWATPTGKERRPTINLGRYVLQRDDLAHPYKRFAGYTWRDVHVAFSQAPTARFSKLDCTSTAARNSTSASLPLYQVAAFAYPHSMSRRVLGQEEGYHCSHLCNNSHCFNPDHMWYESKRMNQARERCRKRVALTVVGGKSVGCEHSRVDDPSCVMMEVELNPVVTQLGFQRSARSSAEVFPWLQVVSQDKSDSV